MADYNAILAAVNQEAEAKGQAAVELQQLYYAMGQNAAQQAALQEQAPVTFNGKTETLLSAQTRMQADLEAQNKARQFASDFDYDALSYQIMEETKKTVQQRLQIADKIQQDASVSFWEDPGLALLNAFTLPWDQQELAGTEQKLTALQDSKNKVDAQITTFAETTSKLKESLTQAGIEDVTRALAAEQSIKLIDAHNRALAIDAQGISAVSQMNSAQLQALQAGYNIMATQEQREAMAEERRLRREEREAARAIKENKVKMEVEDIELVKKALRDASPDGSIRFSDEQIRQGLERKNPLLLSMRDRGSVMQLQGRAAYGEDPLEIQQFFQATGMPVVGEGQRQLAAAVNEAATIGGGTAGDKNAKAAAAKTALSKKFESWQSNVSNGDKTNPLGLPAFETLKASAAITSNPGYQFVADLVDGEKTKDQQIDVDMVYGRVINAVAERKIKVEDAVSLIAEIGTYGTQVSSRLNKVYQFTGIDQTAATAYVTPGSDVGNFAKWAGPVIAGAGIASGVGAIPAIGVGAGFSVVGNAMEGRRIAVNLLDRSSVKAAVTAGIQGKLSKMRLNTAGEMQPSDTGIYPSLFKEVQ
jgi:hypothetical protein